MKTSSNKAALKSYIEAQRTPASIDAQKAVENFFHPDAQINITYPFQAVSGGSQFHKSFVSSLIYSFEHLWRSDYIAFGGEFEDGEWVTCTGYYHGRFSNSWLGIQPSEELAQLRFGEFHRMQQGRAVESYIFLDIPELMIACGQWPIQDSPGRTRGFTGHLAGPLAGDGLQWHDNDRQRSESSYLMVTEMLRSLATEDESWRPYWHEDMLWYGPAAFGSFVGLENFASFQVPFEQTFSEWIGGSVKGSETKHFTRFADGDYICSGGWPSLNAVQAKTFLGQPSSGKRLYMRVCDWWRREGDLLVENWVIVDIPHVLSQLGYELFPGFSSQNQ